MILNTVAIAEGFYEQINELAPGIEANRRIPQQLADKMADAGLFRMLVPTQYGGLECQPQQFFDTLAATGRADGAVGWCLMIGSTTGLLSASLHPDWAQKIYGDNPHAITVGVTAPIGKAEVNSARNGLTISGRWPFGSGSQIANWICGGCSVTENGQPRVNKHGQPEPVLAFFPALRPRNHRQNSLPHSTITRSTDASAKTRFIYRFTSTNPRHCIA